MTAQHSAAYWDTLTARTVGSKCKRANPAMANWCFASARLDGSDIAEYSWLEAVVWDPTRELFASRLQWNVLDTPAHIALEVRVKGVKGDASSAKPKDLDDALRQACVGANGLLDFRRQNPAGLVPGVQVVVLPVIVTTASLWYSAVDLGRSDRLTGDVSLKGHGFEQVPWIGFQYNQGLGVRHSLPRPERRARVAEIVEATATRTVFVVHMDGLKAFLQWASRRLRKEGG